LDFEQPHLILETADLSLQPGYLGGMRPFQRFGEGGDTGDGDRIGLFLWLAQRAVDALQLGEVEHPVPALILGEGQATGLARPGDGRLVFAGHPRGIGETNLHRSAPFPYFPREMLSTCACMRIVREGDGRDLNHFGGVTGMVRKTAGRSWSHGGKR
jgi:hypothetical protein